MPIDVVLGEQRNLLGVRELLEKLEAQPWTGTLYIGYPVLPTADELLFIDALLTTVEHGVVAFELADHDNLRPDSLRARQNDIYSAMFQKLFASPSLRAGRHLAVEVSVITLSPRLVESLTEDDLIAGPPNAVLELLKKCRPITNEQLRLVSATIQRVASIRPPRRRSNVTRSGSKGAVITEIEKEIVNLDHWQKAAAIEMPDGPQRVRGLAGSGKTIVLALKAAYMHAANPAWRIALTFQTRSLYQQFRELVRRFMFETTREEPDWTRLQVLHAWGSAGQPGIYSEVCRRLGRAPTTFTQARTAFGYEHAFEGVCDDLCRHIDSAGIEPFFDAILIDEAQDLPRSFFEIAYHITDAPHRIVFAYDELQNLSEYSMEEPQALFGRSAEGGPRVSSLANQPGLPRRDIVLPVCYRNTPWALTIAHALGFGVYRDDGLVQFFDEPSLFGDIGYVVESGSLTPGDEVALTRGRNATPDFFRQLLDDTDAVIWRNFTDTDEEARWIASEVARNLSDDELQPRDILIVITDPSTGRSDAVKMISALREHGITSHVAGVTSSVDELFSDDSVAISGVFRAKGNEAPMVYIMNAQYAIPGSELIKRRNALFTAITRSRAWVRICGVGEGMERLEKEMGKTREAHYSLRFRVPTAEQLQRIRRIHREISREERNKLDRQQAELFDLVKSFERGDYHIDVLPKDLRRRLRNVIGDEPNSDPE